MLREESYLRVCSSLTVDHRRVFLWLRMCFMHCKPFEILRRWPTQTVEEAGGVLNCKFSQAHLLACLRVRMFITRI